MDLYLGPQVFAHFPPKGVLGHLVQMHMATGQYLETVDLGPGKRYAPAIDHDAGDAIMEAARSLYSGLLIPVQRRVQNP